jgi:hypothetical protein
MAMGMAHERTEEPDTPAQAAVACGAVRRGQGQAGHLTLASAEL